MKYIVLKRFIDKLTKKYYAAGDIYESNDEKRIKELQEKGYLGEKIEEPKKNEEPSVLDGNVTQVQESITDELSTDELKQLLEMEQSGSDRKGVVQHIKSLLPEE